MIIDGIIKSFISTGMKMTKMHQEAFLRKLTVHIESNFLADGRWNPIAGQTEVDSRIVPADVRQRELRPIMDHDLPTVPVPIPRLLRPNP